MPSRGTSGDFCILQIYIVREFGDESSALCQFSSPGVGSGHGDAEGECESEHVNLLEEWTFHDQPALDRIEVQVAVGGNPEDKRSRDLRSCRAGINNYSNESKTTFKARSVYNTAENLRQDHYTKPLKS